MIHTPLLALLSRAFAADLSRSPCTDEGNQPHGIAERAKKRLKSLVPGRGVTSLGEDAACVRIAQQCSEHAQ
jgi:hypothetical protein